MWPIIPFLFLPCCCPSHFLLLARLLFPCPPHPLNSCKSHSFTNQTCTQPKQSRFPHSVHHNKLSYNQTGTVWTHRVSTVCWSSPTCPHSWQAPCVLAGPESTKCFTHSVHFHSILYLTAKSLAQTSTTLIYPL